VCDFVRAHRNMIPEKMNRSTVDWPSKAAFQIHYDDAFENHKECSRNHKSHEKTVDKWVADMRVMEVWIEHLKI